MSTLADDYCLTEYETIIKYLLFFRFKTNPGPDAEFEKRSHQYIRKKTNEAVNRQFINYLIIQLSKKFSGIIQKDFVLLKKEFNSENNYSREQLEKITLKLRFTKQTLENLTMTSNDELENYIEGAASNHQKLNNYQSDSNNYISHLPIEKESDENVEMNIESESENEINLEVSPVIMLTQDDKLQFINYQENNEESLPTLDIELINRLRKENNLSDSLWEFLIQRLSYYDRSITSLKKQIKEIQNK
jgi:hypothetical protein